MILGEASANGLTPIATSLLSLCPVPSNKKWGAPNMSGLHCNSAEPFSSVNVNVNGSHFRRVYTTICVSSRSMLSTKYSLSIQHTPPMSLFMASPKVKKKISFPLSCRPISSPFLFPSARQNVVTADT